MISLTIDREILMNLNNLAATHIADYLTADRGTRWWILDGNLISTSPAESLHEESAVFVVASPGVANLDSTWWTQGLTRDDDGFYWVTAPGRQSQEGGGEEIGSLKDVVRWCCDNGDVSSFIDGLAAKIAEATSARRHL